VPSPPTAPLEVRNLSANSVTVEWGVPETDGGAPLQGYNIAIRDVKKTMWMEVGRVDVDVHKFNIKDLQVKCTGKYLQINVVNETYHIDRRRLKEHGVPLSRNPEFLTNYSLRYEPNSDKTLCVI